MFLIGAGCSVSADIPLASEVAEMAVLKLAADYWTPDTLLTTARLDTGSTEALNELVDGNHFPERFRPGPGKPRWGELYNYIFSEHMKHPNEQRDFIASLVETEGLHLNWSHACLGELVKQRFVHTVLTTNFDQLVLKGIIRTGIVPVVADGLESLSRISATPKWPQVVHVHGSMHTYELRNSYESLRETQDDRGLQSLMLTILKETTVLVVVGYFGGEEGIMRLLQDAARALPRMVIYWVAFENDYALLSSGARELLELGEHKYFILNQEADSFFNKLLGELGVGPPGWIKEPLTVLKEQVRITSGDKTSDDVGHLISAYEERVAYAVEKGRKPDEVQTEAIVLRSRNRFEAAGARIACEPNYREDDGLLRLHAISLVNHYNRMPKPDHKILRVAIEELETLVARGAEGPAACTGSPGDPPPEPAQRVGGRSLSTRDARGSAPTSDDGTKSNVSKMVQDTEELIEARRDLYEVLADDRDGVLDDEKANERSELLAVVSSGAEAAQLRTKRTERAWAVMEFYKAETCQLRAEQLKHSPGVSGPESIQARKDALEQARSSYEIALPVLNDSDVERARECKEGLAGALSNLAEIYSKEDPKSPQTRSYLRQSKALFLEVIDFSRRNTPGRELAGALENLADVVETTADLQPEEAHTLRNEALQLLQASHDLYKDISDIQNATRMQSRMAKLRAREFSPS